MISIIDGDLVRAVRVARMTAKCDCQEKGGDIKEHFATIICNDNERMEEQIAKLKEVLLDHKEFHELMHSMPTDWTVNRSIELHAETKDLISKLRLIRGENYAK
ncbi:coil containing protein [Vibrio phage 1.177.O._10N.286.45.E10]|nr:coil containing protein [Vibrio phage 1.177.O._10N.286.45.E10]